jgi:hypothetical protein
VADLHPQLLRRNKVWCGGVRGGGSEWQDCDGQDHENSFPACRSAATPSLVRCLDVHFGTWSAGLSQEPSPVLFLYFVFP